MELEELWNDVMKGANIAKAFTKNQLSGGLVVLVVLMIAGANFKEAGLT